MNTADFQIAPNVRPAMSFDGLRSAIESRPADKPALRVVSDYPGQDPVGAPTAWLAPPHTDRSY